MQGFWFWYVGPFCFNGTFSSTDVLNNIDCDDTDAFLTPVDSDADGLNDCEEQELGTDPEKVDSDGDGFADADEVDCVSNPADANEQCYACGWEHNDPGSLVSTGNDYGDVVGNVQLPDQCDEVVDLWDFHGEYHILYMTAAW